MTAEEIEPVKEVVLRDLPRVLESDPRFVVVEGIISEKFPRRDEFARSLEKLQAMRGEGVQRFEAMDRRFEARRPETAERSDAVDRRFESIDQRCEDLTNEVRGPRQWMPVNVGGLQGRVGQRMDDDVAGAFCYGLERGDIKPKNVKLRQKITDHEGVVFRPSREREVDIIPLDREIVVFEVKAAADEEDVEGVAGKVTLVRHQNANGKVDGVFVSLGADARLRRRCAEKGLRLIP